MPYKVTDECVACGTCLDACESKAIEEGEEKYSINSKCTECGQCVETCPTEAIVKE
jgi:NAD-dependent dihydropyrimidine dehydrogenase PreA subunit